MAFLSTISGPSKGERNEIQEGETIVGRHPDCQIVVEVGAVSRHHAKLMCAGNDIHIKDLGSRNGTFVNGQLISDSHLLREGDQIRICEVEFSFHHGQQPGFMGAGTATQLLEDSSSAFGVLLVDDESEGDESTSQVAVRRDDSGTVRVEASNDVRLKALLEISRSLGGQLELDEVLPATIEGLFRIFPQADRGFIVMETSDGKLIPR